MFDLNGTRRDASTWCVSSWYHVYVFCFCFFFCKKRVHIRGIALVFETRSKDFRGKRRIKRIHWSGRENASPGKYFARGTRWAVNGFQTCTAAETYLKSIISDIFVPRRSTSNTSLSYSSLTEDRSVHDASSERGHFNCNILFRQTSCLTKFQRLGVTFSGTRKRSGRTSSRSGEWQCFLEGLVVID